MAHSTLRKCDVCEEYSGVYFCNECQQVMCKPCRTCHGTIQVTKSHSVTEASTDDRTILSSNISCKIHDKDFVLFCETCECLVCLVCITSVHKGHSFHSIEEAANSKRIVIQQKVTGLQAKINNISRSIEDVKSTKQPRIKERCEQYVGNIRILASEFHKIIDFVTDENINEATEFSVLEQQQLEVDVLKLEKSHKEYTETTRNLAQSLNQKHDISFLVVEQSLRAQFEGLSEVFAVHEPEKFKDVDKIEFTSQIIDQIRLKYNIRIIEEKENEIQMLQEELENEKTEHTENEASREVEMNDLKQKIEELNNERYSKWSDTSTEKIAYVDKEHTRSRGSFNRKSSK